MNAVKTYDSQRHLSSYEVDDIEKVKLRKADTVFIFDPKVHMNLSEKDIEYLDKLEDYENNYQWMNEVSLL